jgi:hypothetical protein
MRLEPRGDVPRRTSYDYEHRTTLRRQLIGPYWPESSAATVASVWNATPRALRGLRIDSDDPGGLVGPFSYSRR